MTFSIEKERLTAISGNGVPMGHITFPGIRPGLVNISQVISYPRFRGQGVEDAMMDTLLKHLTDRNQKAALTSPAAQQYISSHPHWKHILPGKIHMTAH